MSLMCVLAQCVHLQNDKCAETQEADARTVHLNGTTQQQEARCMLSRDTASRNFRPATLGDNFTSAELERLATLRRYFSEHAEHSEMMMDPAQLEFARWLYDHGRIGERTSHSA